jgi:hypothetical protein
LPILSIPSIVTLSVVLPALTALELFKVNSIGTNTMTEDEYFFVVEKKPIFDLEQPVGDI